MFSLISNVQSDAEATASQEPSATAGIQSQLGQGGRGQEGQDPVRHRYPFLSLQHPSDRAQLRGDVLLLDAQGPPAAGLARMQRGPSLGTYAQHSVSASAHDQRDLW